MMFFNNLNIQYPSLKGKWLPIFIEPIVGSGERIAIAIAYSFSNGELILKQVIRQDVIEGIYGGISSGFSGIVSSAIESISIKHLQISELQNIKVPFSGILFGPITECYASDENDLLVQAVSMTASLGTISFDTESEHVSDDGKGNERFITAIHNETLTINPGIIQNFNRKLSVGKGKIQTRYGFVNQKIAANFGTISPAYISQYANNIKAKILDLEALKIYCEEEHPETMEMIVWRPEKNDPLVSKKAMSKIEDTVAHLRDLTQTIDLGFSEVFSIRQAAEYLTSKAA